jgi:hypothetical protein
MKYRIPDTDPPTLNLQIIVTHNNCKKYSGSDFFHPGSRITVLGFKVKKSTESRVPDPQHCCQDDLCEEFLRDIFKGSRLFCWCGKLSFPFPASGGRDTTAARFQLNDTKKLACYRRKDVWSSKNVIELKE